MQSDVDAPNLHGSPRHCQAPRGLQCAGRVPYPPVPPPQCSMANLSSACQLVDVGAAGARTHLDARAASNGGVLRHGRLPGVMQYAYVLSHPDPEVRAVADLLLSRVQEGWTLEMLIAKHQAQHG